MTLRLQRSAGAAAAFAALGIAIAFPSAQGTVTPPQPKFTVPAGFEVVRVAGPPLVDRPIVADFDERGRLYVADSSGSNDKVEKQLADRPHRIVRLEDKDGDGVFDTSVVFADRMMLPKARRGSTGRCTWALRPASGNSPTPTPTASRTARGVVPGQDADRLRQRSPRALSWARRVDLMDQGRVCRADVRAAGKPPLVTKAADVFRRRPGETLVEPVITGGMDNRSTSPSLTDRRLPCSPRRSSNIRSPAGGDAPTAGNGRRLRWGVTARRRTGVIDGHPRTGDLRPGPWSATRGRRVRRE